MALQAKFDQGHKRTEAQKLKRLIEGKLAQMVTVNASRMDLAEKFKKVCRDLLATLKREKLVLDWREKQQAKAGVMQAIKFNFRRLPAAFSSLSKAEKLARAYAHVYDKFGHG